MKDLQEEKKSFEEKVAEAVAKSNEFEALMEEQISAERTTKLKPKTLKKLTEETVAV